MRTFVPAYTIRLPIPATRPLGASPAARRTGDPPSDGILKVPAPLASLPSVMIHLPSGDQQLEPLRNHSLRDRLEFGAV